MMEQTSSSYIDVRVDKTTMDIVVKSFRYMIDHSEVVDWAMPCVPPLDALKNITEKLEVSNAESENAVVIPMTQVEWDNYSALVDHAGTVIPKNWGDERNFLEDLSDHYAEIDPDGSSVIYA